MLLRGSSQHNWEPDSTCLPGNLAFRVLMLPGETSHPTKLPFSTGETSHLGVLPATRILHFAIPLSPSALLQPLACLRLSLLEAGRLSKHSGNLFCGKQPQARSQTLPAQDAARITSISSCGGGGGGVGWGPIPGPLPLTCVSNSCWVFPP